MWPKFSFETVWCFGTLKSVPRDYHSNYPLQLLQGIADIPSSFQITEPHQDNIGQFPDIFFPDNFSETVFSQLPLDLQKMFRVKRTPENKHNGKILCDREQQTLLNTAISPS